MIAGILPKIAGLDQTRQAYRIRPSGISVQHDGEWHGRCPRAAAYDRLGFIPDDRPGRMMLVLDDSSWAEHLTADWIRKTSFVLHSEQMGLDCMDIEGVHLPAWHCDVCHKESRVTRDLPIADCTRCLQPGNRLHGHTDGILSDLEFVERVYEHKAINHFAFNRYWNSELPIAYITQPLFYLIGLKKLLVDIKEVLLVLKNKNTSQYMDYLIEYDQEADIALIKEIEHSGYGKQVFSPPKRLEGLVNSAVKTFQQTEWYARSSEELGKAVLPPRPFHFDAWQCDYCPFQKTCWEGYEQEFAELETNAVIEPEMGADFAGLMERELWLAEKENGAKRERAELRDKFKKIVRDNLGMRSGRATGPDGKTFSFNLTLATGSRLDLERLPWEIRQEYSEKTFTERLMIREWKQQEKKKK